MAKAKKLPSGSWRVQVYNGKKPDGKPDYISITAETEKEANYLALQHQLDFKRRQRPANLTVGEAIDKYIESKNNILSPSTIRGYKRMRRNNLGLLEHRTLGKINSSDIQKHINFLSLELSPKTVRNVYGLIISSLSEYSPGTSIRVKLPQKIKPDVYIPTIDDISRLIECARGSDIFIPLILAVSLGLRRSEIAALTWDDIDFKRCAISVNKALVRDADSNLIEKSTKSYSGKRKIQMPKIVAEALKDENQSSGRVTSLSLEQISDRFKSLISKAGVEYFSFHKLRHFNASIMLALNIPTKYAIERMGHSTDNMLKTVYEHTYDSVAESVDAKVNSYISSIISHDISHADLTI